MVIKSFFRKLLVKEINMTTYVKHVGKIKSSGSRVIVIFNSIPDDPDNCLVVLNDTLSQSQADELHNILHSSEGQRAKELCEVLHRKSSTDGFGSVLQTLHNRRKLSKYPIDEILLTPNNYTAIPLRNIVSLKNDVQLQEESQEVSAINNVKVYNDEDKVKMAANLMYQASLLEQEVKAIQKSITEKKNQAYKYNPSLKKKKDDSVSS